MPGFVVLVPSDEFCARSLVKQMAEHVGPVYMRTGRPKAPLLYSAADTFQIGKAKQHGNGRDVAIVACGMLVGQALLAQSQLEDEGISARVIDMHTLKPLDHEIIASAARECSAIVTAEEHVLEGGLGALVAQSAASSHPVPIEFVGVQNTYAESATPDQLMEKYGLTAPSLVAAVKRVLKRK